MSGTPTRGLAHLIGSVPLATTEEVFRRLAGALGPVLSRLPDGETGERRRWIYWQRTMLERHPAMEVDHLCYGSPADQHLVMPKDTAILAEIGRAIAARVRRGVDFLHLPVPRERDAAAYLAPLRGLRLPPATRLYLGLIHHGDGEGDRRRIDAARAVVGGGFGVATECGWARGDPARLDGLLESHLRAVDYLTADR